MFSLKCQLSERPQRITRKISVSEDLNDLSGGGILNKSYMYNIHITLLHKILEFAPEFAQSFIAKKNKLDFNHF